MAPSRKARLRALRRRRSKLLEELAGLDSMIGGSFFERFSTCSRPTCGCHTGKRHGPRGYVSLTRDGLQKQHYVPKGQIEAVRKGIAQYRRFLTIMERITAINLQLMREGTLDDPHA